MIGCFSGPKRPTAAQNIAGPADYFERVLAVAAAACECSEAVTKSINIGGGKRAIIHFCDSALENLLFPAVAHQELSEEKIETNFKILACDSAHSGIPMWSPPWTNQDYVSSGDIVRYNNEGFCAFFQLGILRLYDVNRRIGLWWTRDYTQLPLHERAAPFLILFHWCHALGGDSSFLIHAAAIGSEDRGAVLLAGRGGSGKSTTALASLLDDTWSYLADDYCVVRAGAERPTVHSLYCSAKLDAKTLAAFPALSRRVSLYEIGREPGGKIGFDLYRSFPESFRRELPLRAMVLPRVSKENNNEGQPRFTRVGSGAAARALAPSTLFQLPGVGANNFRMIAALTNRIPSFQLALGGEPALVPRFLQQFMQGLGRSMKPG